jgi:hypothetical protein
MWMEEAVVLFEVLCRNLPEGTDENHGRVRTTGLRAAT